MSDKTKAAVAQIRGTMPVQHQLIVDHLKELLSEVDKNLHYSVENTILRQNQGKAQLLDELILLMNT